MDDQILVVEKSPMICRFVERPPWEQSANLWQAPLPHFKSWTSGQLSILLIQHLVNFSNNVMKSARSHDVRYFAIFLHCPREFPIFLVFTSVHPPEAASQELLEVFVLLGYLGSENTVTPGCEAIGPIAISFMSCVMQVLG